MLLKRVFSRLDTAAAKYLRLEDTLESCKDLEWVLLRYPMVFEGDAEAYLYERARHYDSVQYDVLKVLTGDYERPIYNMALPPRPYQVDAAALAENVRGLLCADKLGLGKTVTALTLLSNPATLPALAVVPTHLQHQWKSEANKFLPDLSVEILTSGTPYSLDNPDIIISTYYKLHGWVEFLSSYCETVVFDECQDLRRAGSKKYSAAKCIAYSTNYRLGLSATPIYNYGGEFYNLMDCLAPGFLGSQQEFLREWCLEGHYQQKPRLENPDAFGKYLRDRGRMILRTREDVEMDLPAVTKVIHEIEADLEYLQTVKTDATELARFILDTGGAKGFDVMKASQEFSNKLRQATGIAKAPYVASFVKLLLEEGNPVVLCGWHREVYRLWEEAFRDYSPVFFTGTETPAQKQRSVDSFLNGATNLFIMSLRSGSGLDGLQKRCSTIVFGELDWSPGVIEQCIGRLHRDGQDHTVFAYFLTALAGADPTMVDVLGIKKQQLEGVLGTVFKSSQIEQDHIKKLAKAYLEEL